MPTAPSSPPFIAAIGASAGGLESITELLKALPINPGAGIIVMQHSSPRKVSLLPDILARNTFMPVVELKDGMRIQPNHVYVAPSGFDTTLRRGRFEVCARETRAAIDGQIDKLFASIAEQCGPRGMAIVLSGTGSDGTSGLRQVKAAGGATFAEAPGSARHPGMPQSAIAAGVADRVLGPASIARRIAAIAGRPSGAAGVLADTEDRAEAIEAPLLRIFRTLRASKNVDFSEYKPKTLRRRIARRMSIRHTKELTAYAELVATEPQEAESLFRDLLIGVTSFFRDRALFQLLERQVLPRLIAEKKREGALRLWVPGCASGQEVYSLAICVVEALAKLKVQLEVQIFGTDVSEDAIARARSGIYPAAAATEITAERWKRHFIRKSGSIQINRSIRDLCTFAQQNLCEDPPFSKLDLISCRNVMIYFETSLQRKCVPLFYYALNPSGYLVLGGSETIGAYADLFALMDKKNKVYRKKSGAVPASIPPMAARAKPAAPAVKAAAARKLPVPGASIGKSDVQSAADQLILTHFAPCGVVIDSNLQVWHFRGDTTPFLTHGPGRANLNILKMVRPVLATDLAAAIHHAQRTKEGVRKEGLVLEGRDGPRDVQLEVIPFQTSRGTDPWLLVVFETRDPVLPSKLNGATRKRHDAAGYAREISRLRLELRSTKESLQSIIEAQEAATEEVKSANEEIESSNEELQSTNEELETAKEELQSTNEELSTVNDELNNRNLEITEVNNDLNNLLSSINVAVLLVDGKLTIRRTTPLAEKIFNVIPSDTGRRLSDINPNFKLPGFIELIRDVIDNLSPLARDVVDKAGATYQLRIRPYRTRSNVIDGVIITMIEVITPRVPLDGPPNSR